MQPLASAVEHFSGGISELAASQIQRWTNADRPVKMVIHTDETRGDGTLHSVTTNNKETIDRPTKVDQLLDAVFAQQDYKLSATSRTSGSTPETPQGMFTIKLQRMARAASKPDTTRSL